VVAAEGEGHVLGGPLDVFDLTPEAQGGQVQHDRDADAGADVCGAGGQVAEAIRKAEVDGRLDLIVEPIGGGVRVGELQAGADALEAEVVFLVDHDRGGFAGVKDQAAATGAVGVLLADEVPLDQEGTVEVVQVFDLDVDLVLEQLSPLSGVDDAGRDLPAGVGVCPREEREALDIAGEADARRDHDLV
jgi:hypothetical protein